MAKTIILTKEITSCRDCPHFNEGPTQSTDDFDSGNDWFCDNKQHRLISGFVEWHEVRKIEIPEWCPLTKSKP